MSEQKKCPLTTSTGMSVADDQNSTTAGEQGPLTFMGNVHLFEKLAHFNRERIPERVVHARGTGAYGEFVLTKDLSEYTCADFLQKVGTKTSLFIRFSTVGGGQDSSDYARDPRGFAVKFYTKEGNWDMVGNNTPVFFLRDPIKFPDFIHSQKKNPRTNLPDAAAIYEFWANSPQSLHQVSILMSDRGIPYSYRHMHGFSSHTLSFWNANKERFWVKWHFKTNQGIRTVTNAEAAQLPANGVQHDLVDSIDKGDFPSWTVQLQIMTQAQAKDYKINPFDLTKIWPHADFPVMDIGQMTLNKNVENYFSEVEQATFSPGHLVPGISISPDKMLQARILAYGDAHRYRVGANADQLPVNTARCPVQHYQRDGHMAGMTQAADHTNQTSKVNFYPNEQAGSPQPDPAVAEPPLPILGEAWIQTYDTQDQDNFSQAGDLYRLMSEDQKNQLVNNIAEGLKHATKAVQDKMVAQFTAADADYGKRVARLLK